MTEFKPRCPDCDIEMLIMGEVIVCPLCARSMPLSNTTTPGFNTAYGLMAQVDLVKKHRRNGFSWRDLQMLDDTRASVLVQTRAAPETIRAWFTSASAYVDRMEYHARFWWKIYFRIVETVDEKPRP